ncbi:MAG TPA: Gmad2 immunoglobulin-like domain-containing protein [Candidatus Limnocylindrales bacterium]|nr:Gmad2 immunoglobulin-like domain-containing protein [Candidatus Limnocylindrales bacterium]
MNNRWYVAGIAALIAGIAVGWFLLRPLPRPATIDPDPGYLIVDSTAAGDAASAAAGAAGTGAPGTGSGTGEASPPPVAPAPADELVLDTPKSNALVSSPLWVVGRARGSWFFEAEFPIRLYDGNDTLLTWASGRAQGDWTTHDFVPFSVVLNFAEPTTDTGTLVLERDNPSGLPENAAEVRVPVRFR